MNPSVLLLALALFGPRPLSPLAVSALSVVRAMRSCPAVTRDFQPGRALPPALRKPLARFLERGHVRGYIGLDHAWVKARVVGPAHDRRLYILYRTERNRASVLYPLPPRTPLKPNQEEQIAPPGSS